MMAVSSLNLYQMSRTGHSFSILLNLVADIAVVRAVKNVAIRSSDVTTMYLFQHLFGLPTRTYSYSNYSEDETPTAEWAILRFAMAHEAFAIVSLIFA
jgi:hypothetical protein